MRRARQLIGLTALALLAAAVARELSQPRSERQWQGRVAGIPYDLRRPTLARVRERWWSPEDPRQLTPHVFGVGWSVNLGRARALRRARRGAGA
jgi:hypothetical protein